MIPPSQQSDAEAPIFLVGAERSGTTLLRLMLDFHPTIAFHNEFEYVVSRISPQGQLPDMASYRTWLRHNWIFQDAHFSLDEGLDYRDLVHSFLMQKLARDGKSLIGATVHHHFDRLRLLWPNARYLHLVRDPRDVARSTIAMGWAGNVWAGVTRWLTAEHTWQALRPHLPHGTFCDIRFEDLIQDPAAQLTRICEFMGTTFSERMFDYAQHSTYKLPNPERVYQWRTKLSQEQIGLVEARTGELLVDRGYELAATPPLRVEAARARHLELESERYCRRFRRRRYGLPLLLLNKLAQWAPGQALARITRRRIDDIDRSHLQ